MRASRNAAVVLLLAARAAQAQGEDPQRLLAQLEARVLAAPHVTIEAQVQASGLTSLHLSGTLELKERNRASASWRGDLRGEPAELAYSSDGRAAEMKAAGRPRTEGIGRESNHALLAGALRMGLLHNVLRLAELQLPDHAADGFDAWAMTDNFRPTTFALGGDLQGAMSFGYDLVIDGATAGSVRLWLDPLTGLPKRQQLVLREPGGETIFTEDYTRFALE